MDGYAKELGYQPYARWLGCGFAGYQEDLMGIAVAYSNVKALKHLGLDLDDIDIWECNKAFAAQNLAAIKEMENLTGKKINMDKWNIYGGAIAIGHPNGASGARIAWWCMKELEKSGGKYGVFSSCCGGGQGATAVIENLRR